MFTTESEDKKSFENRSIFDFSYG